MKFTLLAISSVFAAFCIPGSRTNSLPSNTRRFQHDTRNSEENGEGGTRIPLSRYRKHTQPPEARMRERQSEESQRPLRSLSIQRTPTFYTKNPEQFYRDGMRRDDGMENRQSWTKDRESWMMNRNDGINNRDDRMKNRDDRMKNRNSHKNFRDPRASTSSIESEIQDGISDEDIEPPRAYEGYSPDRLTNIHIGYPEAGSDPNRHSTAKSRIPTVIQQKSLRTLIMQTGTGKMGESSTPHIRNNKPSQVNLADRDVQSLAQSSGNWEQPALVLHRAGTTPGGSPMTSPVRSSHPDEQKTAHSQGRTPNYSLPTYPRSARFQSRKVAPYKAIHDYGGNIERVRPVNPDEADKIDTTVPFVDVSLEGSSNAVYPRPMTQLEPSTIQHPSRYHFSCVQQWMEKLSEAVANNSLARGFMIMCAGWTGLAILFALVCSVVVLQKENVAVLHGDFAYTTALSSGALAMFSLFAFMLCTESNNLAKYPLGVYFLVCIGLLVEACLTVHDLSDIAAAPITALYGTIIQICASMSLATSPALAVLERMRTYGHDSRGRAVNAV